MLNVELALTPFGSPFPAIPSLVSQARKPCYLSQTAGLHRFLILFKDYNTEAFFTGIGFSGAKIRRKNEICREIRRKTENLSEKLRKTENLGENLRKIEIICKFMCISVRITCKFMCISVRIICKSLLISVRFVRFFAAMNNPRKALLPFYLFTFKCPCRKNRNYYLCTMRLPESER